MKLHWLLDINCHIIYEWLTCQNLVTFGHQSMSQYCLKAFNQRYPRIVLISVSWKLVRN